MLVALNELIISVPELTSLPSVPLHCWLCIRKGIRPVKSSASEISKRTGRTYEVLTGNNLWRPVE